MIFQMVNTIYIVIFLLYSYYIILVSNYPPDGWNNSTDGVYSIMYNHADNINKTYLLKV